MPEVSGTVDRMSPTGKGFKLNEYESWFNFSTGKGRQYDGPRPFEGGAAITVTYEETTKADGSKSFWALQAWPTTGGKPAPGPQPTTGPTSRPPGAVEPLAGEVMPLGPTPTPPNREQSILFQVCLKAAQEWVLAVEALAKTPAEVLTIADLYYAQGLRLINGESLALGEPEMPPEELPA